MGKILAGILVLLLFSYLGLSNFFYIDLANGCFIKIIPGLEFNNHKIIEGITVLKNASFDDYKKLCKRVNTIDPNVQCGGFEGGCYDPNIPDTIYVSTASESLEWVAGVVVHETCHAYQHSEKRNFDELECHQEDDRLIKHLVEFSK